MMCVAVMMIVMLHKTHLSINAEKEETCNCKCLLNCSSSTW